MRRIIVITGSIETLGYFSLQLAEGFQKAGREVFIWDMTHPVESQEAFAKLPDPENSLLVTFNFIGLCNEGQFASIWERMELPIWCIMVDSPMYYVPHLQKMQEYNLTAQEKLFHPVCIDRNHCHFVERFFPLFGEVLFLPLAGNFYLGESGMDVHSQMPGMEERNIPEMEERNIPEMEELSIPEMEERNIPVIFTGNYVALENLMPNLDKIEEGTKDFLFEVIEDLLANVEVPVEEACLKHLHLEAPELSQEEQLELMHRMVFVDLYVRSWYRGKIVSCVADAGVPIFCTGKDWELAPCTNKLLLTHTGHEITSAECLQYQRQSKICLNIMPWFKDGAHDRIFNAQLQGCAVCSDESNYLNDIFSPGENIEFFQLQHFEQVPEILQKMLGNPDKLRDLASNGYRFTKENHTWINRSYKLLQKFDKFC